MKILHINTSAGVGGAARAMWRLHLGLLQRDQSSKVVSLTNPEGSSNVAVISKLSNTLRFRISKWIDVVGRNMERYADLPFHHYQSLAFIVNHPWFVEADIINLHNLHGHYFNLNMLPILSRNRPIVWTLHDMWAFTGHCAYSYDCERWRKGCYRCPLLSEPGRSLLEPSPYRWDNTKHMWKRKQGLYQKASLNIVSPSKWLHRKVKESILSDSCSLNHIPYGIDSEIFRPRDKQLARRALNIPSDARVVMFGSANLHNERKGHIFLEEALRSIKNKKRLFILTFGKVQADIDLPDSIPYRHLGFLSDEGILSLAFSAADVFILPTLADNLPLVILEALACGTPIVTFDVGGVPEMVRHLETGYLARYRDTTDLARGIEVLLEDNNLRDELSHRCRAIAVNDFSLDLQARRYLELYRSIVRVEEN